MRILFCYCERFIFHFISFDNILFFDSISSSFSIPFRMYHHTQLPDLNKDANVLARSSQRFIREKSHERAFGQNKLGSNTIYYNDDNILSSNFLTNEDRKQYRVNQNQHTYGAYANSSLPRGPYLQYKYNDRQTTNKFTTYNGRVESTGAATTPQQTPQMSPIQAVSNFTLLL